MIYIKICIYSHRTTVSIWETTKTSQRRVTPLDHEVHLEEYVAQIKLKSMNLGGLENLQRIIIKLENL
jgi:hypothetical protein